jgi:hypothetical protein
MSDRSIDCSYECENRFDYRVGYTEHAKPIFSILSNNKYNVFISMS